MKQLDVNDNVVRWTKNHDVRIPYTYDGTQTYVPDFRIVTRDDLVIVMEAKGYEFEPERCAVKALVAQAFCDARGWIYQVINQRAKGL